ncbi:MAG: hypothetical protein IKJ99_00325 [Oscillospiraceae bacterium]|nr:hypothetical protein [Oscillospiraceae bacterium]
MASLLGKFPVVDGQNLEAQLLQALPGDGAPIITDRSRAYAVNVAFDRIRDVLMQQREVWEQYAPLYWKKKYVSYQMVLTMLDEPLQEEFRLRMQQEFKRAMQLGQLRQEDFDPEAWRTISQWSGGAAGKLGSVPFVRRISANLPKGVKRGIVKVFHLAVNAKRKVMGR